MEGLRIVPRLARRGYYAASLDISDHFMHVGIARDHWKYMVLDLGPPTEGEISVENPRFVYVVVLPMGYTNSPAVIGKVKVKCEYMTLYGQGRQATAVP
jgi:hypothetical protein